MYHCAYIVDLWQYYVCCIWSGVTLCTLFMVLYLWSMYQSGLRSVLWQHIGILISILAAEPRIVPQDFYSSRSQYLCTWNDLAALYLMVWDWRVLWAGPIHFYWPKLRVPFPSSTVFLFSSFFLCVGIVVLGLRTDRVSSLSPGLAVPTSFNNNKNNNNFYTTGVKNFWGISWNVVKYEITTYLKFPNI